MFLLANRQKEFGTMNSAAQTTLILGGSGKTGRRIADRLTAQGRPVRLASRSSNIPFDWHHDSTWTRALAGVGSVYVTYYPDVAVPSAAEDVRRLSRCAVEAGVRKIVLLAGRGEPQVHPAEQAVRESGAAYTILECAFFSQNFSEGAMVPAQGELVFPAGNVAEPFLDCDDIADVAVAALTDDAHAGKTYELTGPRLLTFTEVAATIAQASGRPMRYLPVSFEQYAEVLAPFLPPGDVDFFIELFRWLLDGHNAHLTDDVERILGRKATDFRSFAEGAAQAWRA
jgi:uncharacterized protein YbjT (DUF2867 family)